jgi:hypothetical protein
MIKKNKLMKTRVVNDNNNPIFYNTLETYFFSADIDWSPPVVLEIFDEDTGVFESDDYIGRTVVFLHLAKDAVSRNDDVPRPQWFPVKMGFREDEPAMGQLLVSFSVINPNEQFRRSLNSIRLAPPCDEYQITINVLGLRNLESPGILPVRKPFIHFMLQSLLPPSRSHAIENISTQPSATGSDPTISTVVKFKIWLPNDSLYCPSLTCGVYDYIFKGMAQPLIGSFEIDFGQLQKDTNREFEEQNEKTIEIIKALEQKVRDAEETKQQLEKKREEGRKEKEKEEEMKRTLREIEEKKKREGLALQTTNNLLKNLAKKSREAKYKYVTLDEEGEDIEMGVLEATEGEHETLKKLRKSSLKGEKKEESKEEQKDNIFTKMIEVEEIQEDEHVEKNIAKQLMSEKIEKKMALKNNRTIRMKKMFKQMKLVGKNVVFPNYEYDERLMIHREGIPPPKEVYIAVGYDQKHDSKQKHYRRFYEDELENIEEVMPKSPFNNFIIKRGQSRGLSKGWFWQKRNTDESDQVSTVKEVGEFKAIVSVVNKNIDEELKLVKQTRIDILKQTLNNLSQKLFDEPFNFDYDTLVSAEGRELFAAKLQQMGCENLNIHKYFSLINYQEELSKIIIPSCIPVSF